MYIFKNRVRDSCVPYEVCNECEKVRGGKSIALYYLICVEHNSPVSLCSRCFRKLQKKMNKL